MRHCGVAIAAVAILAPSLAHTADLEVFKAEQPTIYVPNNFLWNGVYVGGFVGGGWGTADWGSGAIQLTLENGNVASLPVALAHENVPLSGFVGGGRVGVNYQVGAWVFGFEGDFAGMTLKGHATRAFSGTLTAGMISVQATGTSVYQTTANWATTFSGRVGYTFDRMLAYGKVGMAVEQDGDAEVSTTTTCTVTTPSTTHICTGSLSRSGTATRYGWTAGAGLEYAFDKNWSAFAEYDHLGFLSHLVNLTVPGSAGTVAGTRLIALNIDRLVVGANYRFNQP
jgi:outer membrane immunogenic protein